MTRSIRRPVLAILLALPLAAVSYALSLAVASPANAVGLGPYFEYRYGDGELELNFDGFTNAIQTTDVSFESDHFGVGLAVDTNVAADKLFNYRLNLGYQRSRRDFSQFNVRIATLTTPLLVNLNDIDSSGFGFNNEFGFGIVRTPSLRVWAGPSLRLGVDVFDTDVDELDVVDVSVGVGASLGVNFHVSDLISLAVTAGYQYTYVAEIIAIEDDARGIDEVETLDGYEHIVKANLTVFFRMPSDAF